MVQAARVQAKAQAARVVGGWCSQGRRRVVQAVHRYEYLLVVSMYIRVEDHSYRGTAKY